MAFQDCLKTFTGTGIDKNGSETKGTIWCYNVKRNETKKLKRNEVKESKTKWKEAKNLFFSFAKRSKKEVKLFLFCFVSLRCEKNKKRKWDTLSTVNTVAIPKLMNLSLEVISIISSSELSFWYTVMRFFPSYPKSIFWKFVCFFPWISNCSKSWDSSLIDFYGVEIYLY